MLFMRFSCRTTMWIVYETPPSLSGEPSLLLSDQAPLNTANEIKNFIK